MSNEASFPPFEHCKVTQVKPNVYVSYPGFVLLSNPPRAFLFFFLVILTHVDARGRRFPLFPLDSALHPVFPFSTLWSWDRTHHQSGRHRRRSHWHTCLI